MNSHLLQDLKLTDLLHRFALSDDFWDIISIAFGNNYDIILVKSLRDQWLKHDFSMLPTIRLLDFKILGTANGAYSKTTNQIYLSIQFTNQASSGSIAQVVLEEIGHYLDALINEFDAIGDEGAVFAELVTGNYINETTLKGLREEDDWASIIINGVLLLVEQANLTGTNGNDNLIGTSSDDTIIPFRGRDTVDGGAGNDLLIVDYSSNTYAGTTTYAAGITSSIYQSSGAWSGSIQAYTTSSGSYDSLYISNFERFQLTGTNANDYFDEGGYGVFAIDGGAGIDTIGTLDFSSFTSDLNIDNSGKTYTETNGNVIKNVERFDQLTTGTGNDNISFTGSLNERISSGDGNDTITAGRGRDTVDGGAGNDLLIVDYSSNTYAGTTTYAAGITSSIYQSAGAWSGSIQAYTTSSGSYDSLYISNFERFQLTGTNANDYFDEGGYGVFAIDGGAGIDTIGTLDFSSFTSDLIIDNSGKTYTETNGNVIKNVERFDQLTTGTGNDDINFTGSLNERISSGEGNDTITAGRGRDTVDGGAGNDLLIVDYSSNTYAGTTTYAAGITSSIYQSSGAWSGSIQAYTTSSGSYDYLSISNFERFQLTGTNANDYFDEGGYGVFAIDGGAGIDTIGTLDFSSFTSDLIIDNSGKTYTETNGNVIKNVERFDQLTTGIGNDNINFTGSLNERISSGDGNDTITAGRGRDTVDGGAGNDLLIVDYSSNTYAGTTTYAAGITSSINQSSGAWSGSIQAYTTSSGNDDYLSIFNFERFQLTGTNANDYFDEGGYGVFAIDGGAGIDTIGTLDFSSFTSDLIIDNSGKTYTEANGNVIKNVERFNQLTTGTGNDNINFTGSLNERISSGEGNDTITAGRGRDTVDGGAGNDLLIVDYSSNTYAGTTTYAAGITSSIYQSAGAWSGSIQAYTTSSGNSDYLSISNFERFQLTGTNANDYFDEGGYGVFAIDGGAGIDTIGTLDFSSFTSDLIIDNSGKTYTETNGNVIKNVERFDQLTTGTGNDNINFTGSLNERISSGEGNDTITAGRGRDTVDGGAGNDLLIVDYSSNTYAGTTTYAAGITSSIYQSSGAWSGSIQAYTTSSGSYDYLSISNFERFQLTGTNANDYFDEGGYGVFAIDGGAGIDTIGTLDFSSFTSDLIIDNSGKTYTETNGNVIKNVERFDQLTTGIGNDNINFTGSLNERISSGDGNDTITAGRGRDTVDGGAGNDLLIVDYSSNTYAGTTTYAAGITSSINQSSGAWSGSIQAYTTSSGNDDYLSIFNFERFQLTGTNANDYFDEGGYGVFAIDGGAGIDTIGTLDFSSFTSDLIIDNSGKTYTEANGNVIKNVERFNQLTTGTGNDNINFTGSLNERISSGEGNDTITAGRGRDTVDGGAGNDLLIVDYSSNTYAGTTTYAAGITSSIYQSAGAWSGSIQAYTTSSGNSDYLSISNFERFQLTGTNANDYFDEGGYGVFAIDGGAGIDTIGTLDFSSFTSDLIIDNSGKTYTETNGNVIKNVERFDQLTTGTGNDDINFTGSLNERISSGEGNDTITAGRGRDTVDGGAGNDLLIVDYSSNTYAGTTTYAAGITSSIYQSAGAWSGSIQAYTTSSGNSDYLSISNFERFQIIGTSSKDDIRTGGGNDIIVGVNPNSLTPGRNEVDSLTGGAGSDRFILGDSSWAGYDDGLTTDAGNADYALITDFRTSEDAIQLRGSISDYLLAVSGLDTRLLINQPGSEPDELIAIIKNQTSLNLASSYFNYVPASAPPIIALAVSPDLAAEDGPVNLVYTFSRFGSTHAGLLVNYTVTGSAILGIDYSGIEIAGASKSVTFAAGSSTATVIVDPIADSDIELDETIALTLAAGTGYTIGTTTAVTGTISNDDPRVSLAVSPAAVTEDGITNLTYTFTRTGATTSSLTVNYTLGGTATLGIDYTGIAATPAIKSITFAAGSATATVTVDPIADSDSELDETIALTLATGSGYTIGTTTAVVGTITNDDVPVITLAVSPASVTEDGATNLIYTFTRTAPTAAALAVNYSVAGTALLVASGTDAADYTGISTTGTIKTVTFAAGSATATVTVDPTADTTLEAAETVALSLAAGTGYTIGTTTAVVGTITNDDVPVLTLAVSPASVTEDGATNLIYTFTRTAPTAAALAVNYTVAGTALLVASGTDAADYTGISTTGTVKTVTFAAGSATATVTVDPTADTTLEAAETVALTLATGSGYTIGTTTAVVGTITNDDVPVLTLAVSPASVTEDGATNLIYTFTRTAPTAAALAVNYTVAGTALLVASGTDAADYTGISTTGTVKTVTFAAGSATATVTVDPTADTTLEAAETVALTLATGSGYTIGTTTAVVGTITNDDVPVITLAVSPASVTEDGATNLIYTFTRSGPTAAALAVNYTVAGTALLVASGTDAADYTGISTTGTVKTVTFAAGSATATVTVDPTADTTIEAAETVALSLAAGTGYTIGTTAAVTGTISNDDLPVITLAVSPAAVAEDGTTNLIYTFTRTAPTAAALTVNYTVAGTALLVASGTDAADYTGISTTGTVKTVTFAAGSATATVTVDPTADTTIEAAETVALSLAAGTGYTIGTTAAVTGTISNDDLPVITLAVSPAAVAEDGTTNLVYTFSRTGPTSSALSVDYTVAGTATLGTDYTGIAATPPSIKTVSFAAGSATATLTIDPTADTTIEPDETVAITLAAGSGYIIGTPTAVVSTIVDDEKGSISGVKWNDINGNGVREDLIQGSNPDIVFVVDVSGSTSSLFEGGSVGDVNSDGFVNRILDAQLAAYIALNNRLVTKGFGSAARVGIVSFDGVATQQDMNPVLSGVQTTTSPAIDLNGNSRRDVEDRLITLQLGGSTNFEAALQQALALLQNAGSAAGSGNIIFLSDGFPNSGGSFTDEVNAILAAGHKISAFGVGTGSSLTDLKIIDPNATIFTSTDQLLAVFDSLGSGGSSFREPGLAGVTVYLDLNNNGILEAGEPTQLTRADDPLTANVDETGQYTFANLAPGTYTMREVVPSGFTQTFPNAPGSHTVVISSGQNVINKNFGNTQPATVTLSVSPSQVLEDGTTNLIYTFTRTGNLSNVLIVNYTVGGSATLGTDYTGIAATPATKTVTFAAGLATAALTIDPTADNTVESDETVALTLAAGTGYTVGTTTAVIGTITNDDSTISLAVSPAQVAEDGSSNLVYTFTRTGSITSALSVNYSISGTADSSDYTGATPGTVKTISFAPGSATATLTIDPSADTAIEADETVALSLAAGTGYTIGTTAAVTGTISNDDLPVITLAVSPAAVAEDGSANLIYTFTRTAPTAAALTVNYTVAGTALLVASGTNAADYTGISTTGTVKTVTFAAGSATATVTVDPTADTTLEADETVALSLAAGSGYTIGTTAAVTGTISNDDLPVITLAVSPASVTEDGSANLIYTFTRTGPTISALTVNYGITGSADATDYSGATPGNGKTISFAAGSATATLTIDPVTDTTIEVNESVVLTLAAGAGYTIGTTTAVTGTIANDDFSVITLAVSPANVTEDGSTNLIYTFTRTAPTAAALAVNYTVAGTALLVASGTDAADYTGISTTGTVKTVTFAAGSATATVTVEPTADTTIEAAETVALSLASGSGYTIGTTTAVTGLLLNDDISSFVTYTLLAAESSLLLLGANRIHGIGNELSNRLTGNSNNNRLAGLLGKDILTGGGNTDSDLFVYNSLAESLLGTGDGFDVITDFSNRDRIFAAMSVETSRLEGLLGNVASLSVADIAGLLTSTAFSANSVVAFSATGRTGTFVAMNDGRDGFQAETDSIVFLSNYSVSTTNFIDFV